MHMHEETMQTIHRLSDERFRLFLAAGHGGLSTQQQERLTTLNNELPMWWDRYRREFAAYRHDRPSAGQRQKAA